MKGAPQGRYRPAPPITRRRRQARRPPLTKSDILTALDRYIFRQGAIPFVVILLCTTAVLWLTQVLQRVDLMVDDGGSLGAFLKVTTLLVPSLVAVIMPFAVLAAVLYAVNVAASDSELPVMAAAGASRLRIARPLLLLSVICGLVVLLINVDLQPRSYRAMKETVELVRSDVAKAFIRSGIFSEVSPRVTVYADEVRPGDQYIGLLIHDARNVDDPVTYTAERGLFRVTTAGPRLLLVRGTVQRIDPATGRVDILRFIETAVDLAAFREPGKERRREGSERYVFELLRPNLDDPYDAQRAGRFIAEGHARLATPLYCIAFAATALAIMLTAPVSRRGLGQRLLLAIVVAVVMRTIGYLLQNAGDANPAVNAIQYALPGGAIAISVAILAGRFWAVPRRATPVRFDRPAPLAEAAS